jgi:hypothetical protein
MDLGPMGTGVDMAEGQEEHLPETPGLHTGHAEDQVTAGVGWTKFP